MEYNHKHKYNYTNNIKLLIIYTNQCSSFILFFSLISFHFTRKSCQFLEMTCSESQPSFPTLAAPPCCPRSPAWGWRRSWRPGGAAPSASWWTPRWWTVPGAAAPSPSWWTAGRRRARHAGRWGQGRTWHKQSASIYRDVTRHFKAIINVIYLD